MSDTGMRDVATKRAEINDKRATCTIAFAKHYEVEGVVTISV